MNLEDVTFLTSYEDVKRGFLSTSLVSTHGNQIDFIRQKVKFPSGVFIYDEGETHIESRNDAVNIFSPRNLYNIETDIRSYVHRALKDKTEFDFVEIGYDVMAIAMSHMTGKTIEDVKKIEQIANKKITRDDSGLQYTGGDVNTSKEFLTEFFVPAGMNTFPTLMGNIGIVLAGRGDETQNARVAIEEVLRLSPPTPYVARYAKEDVVIGEHNIKADSVVVLDISLANRDSKYFVEPDKVKFDRENYAHLSFGYGRHSCIGAQMARFASAIVLDEVWKYNKKWSVKSRNYKLNTLASICENVICEFG